MLFPCTLILSVCVKCVGVSHKEELPDVKFTSLKGAGLSQPCKGWKCNDLFWVFGKKLQVKVLDEIIEKSPLKSGFHFLEISFSKYPGWEVISVVEVPHSRVQFLLNSLSLGVTLLDLVEAFHKRRLSIPVFFLAVKFSSLYFFSVLPLMTLQIDFSLLNKVDSFISLGKTSAFNSFLTTFCTACN